MASFDHSGRRRGAERLIAALAALMALSALPPITAAGSVPQSQAPPPAPTAAPLALAAVEVEPATPHPGTLCHLRVRIENHGERIASALAFAVILGSREVPAISHRVYLVAIPPGESTTVALPNFWSSEGGRPVPSDGRLTVEVRLTAARWVTIDGDRRPPEWTFLGDVPGLPVAVQVTVPVR